MAQQLARFHAAFWGQTHRLDHLEWLFQSGPVNLGQDAQHAHEAWHGLASNARFSEWLSPQVMDGIDDLLAWIVTAPTSTQAFPTTLRHGDCHIGNLLRDANGDLIWADWQAVRLGCGPDDLSFLLQRAEADGATMSRHRVIAAYCNALSAAGVTQVDDHRIHRLMAEDELRTRLLYWPDYLGEASVEHMAMHVQRINAAASLVRS